MRLRRAPWRHEFHLLREFSVVSGFQADETEDAIFLRDAIQRSLARDPALAVDTDVLTELSEHLVTRRLARQLLVLTVRRLSDVCGLKPSPRLTF